MKKIVIVLLCVFSILIAHIAYNISGGVSGLREDIGLEIKARSNPKLRTILNNKNQYPDAMIQSLYRNDELIDFVYNYPTRKGHVYTNTIGSVTKGRYPLLLQYDQRWGYGKYGYNVIGMNGCGPTSAAMIIAGLTGRNNITPYDVASYAYSHGYYQEGTSWSFFTEGMKYYGIHGRNIPLSYSSMKRELMNNRPLICSMRPGDFTTTGHLIVIKGMKQGMFIVNDPNSRKRSNRLWSYDTLSKQIKNVGSFSK